MSERWKRLPACIPDKKGIIVGIAVFVVVLLLLSSVASARTGDVQWTEKDGVMYEAHVEETWLSRLLSVVSGDGYTEIDLGWNLVPGSPEYYEYPSAETYGNLRFELLDAYWQDPANGDFTCHYRLKITDTSTNTIVFDKNMVRGTRVYPFYIPGYKILFCYNQNYCTPLNDYSQNRIAIGHRVYPESVGKVSVVSVPTGATVYFDPWNDGDFAPYGTTPCEIYYASGTHKIKMVKAGYQNWTESVTVVQDETVPVSATLTSDITPPPDIRPNPIAELIQWLLDWIKGIFSKW